MIEQLFSQLLGAGAAKSRADYNTQQKINQLLREGWVRKEEAPPEPFEAVEAVEEDPVAPPDLLTREGAEAIYNSGDAKMAAIINEMLSVIGDEEYSGGGTPQEEVENVFPFLKKDEASATSGLDPNLPDEFGRDAKDILAEEEIIGSTEQDPLENRHWQSFQDYINSFGNAGQGGNLPQRNLNPVNVKYAENGVANKFAIKDSNGNPMTDEHGHLIFPDEKSGWAAANAEIRAKIEGNNRHGIDADSTLAEFGNIYAEDPNWASGVARMLGVDTNTKVGSLNIDTFVETIARQEGWYAGKEIVETPPDNINPDRKSRNFVKRAFKDVRKGIDGLSPTGEEAGHWLKPIAEQLNAMFGKSTPLDMDGFEMGPYHAQRIEHQKMLDDQSRHEDRMKLQREQHDALKAHYESMDETARQRLMLDARIEFAKLEIDTAKAKTLTDKINGGHIPTQDEMDYLESEVEKMIDWLVQEIDDTELAEYVGGYGYSWLWSEGGLGDLMPTLNLMLGLTEEGEEITPGNEPMWGMIDFTADPEIRRGIQERIDFIREVQALRMNRPELFSEAMLGRDQTLVKREKNKRDEDFKNRITEIVGSILERHQGRSTTEGDALSTRVGG